MSSELTRRGGLSRIALLKAAYDLFTSQGYHGTSMRQIAKKAEIALGGVYNHYESKEQVFQAVLQEYHPYNEIFPSLNSTKAETIEQFVHDVSRRIIEAINGRPRFMNLMFIEIVEFNSIHMGEIFSNFLPSMLEVIERLRLIEKGQLREIPSLMLLRAFLGMIFGYYLSEMILAQNSPAEFRTNAVDYFTDIFLFGVLEEQDNGL